MRLQPLTGIQKQQRTAGASHLNFQGSTGNGDRPYHASACAAAISCVDCARRRRLPQARCRRRCGTTPMHSAISATAMLSRAAQNSAQPQQSNEEDADGRRLGHAAERARTVGTRRLITFDIRARDDRYGLAQSVGRRPVKSQPKREWGLQGRTRKLRIGETAAIEQRSRRDTGAEGELDREWWSVATDTAAIPIAEHEVE